jgi:cytochrome P450
MSFLLLLVYFILALLALIAFYIWNAKRGLYNIKTGQPAYEVPIWDLPAYFLSGVTEGYEHVWLLPQIKGKDAYIGWLGPRMFFTANDHKLANEILSDPETFPKSKPSSAKTMSRWMGHNTIVNVNGEDWRRHRASMNPAFQDLDLYQEIFAEKAELVMKSMEMKDGGRVHDINVFMQEMT